MAIDVLSELEANVGKSFTSESAYAWCKAYTKDRASNFYYAFSILPREKREAIYAAYAFSGYVDDIADELTDRGQQEDEIGLARERLRACYAGVREGPLFTALGDAIERCGRVLPLAAVWRGAGVSHRAGAIEENGDVCLVVFHVWFLSFVD